MRIKTGLAVLAAAAIAMAAGSTAAWSAPAKRAVIDFSADKDKKKGKEEKKKSFESKKSQGIQGGGKKGGGQVQFEKKKGGQQGGSKVQFEKKKGGQQGGGKVEFQKKQGGQKFGGAHKGQATAKRLRGLSRGHGQTFVRGRNFSTWRGSGYRRRYHDRWVTFVPLTALAVLLVGGDRFYPYAYIDAPEDYCGGFTEDDCELHWREVETIDGDLIGQCVAYCPWED